MCTRRPTGNSAGGSDQGEAAKDKVAEKAKRLGILELLYTACGNQPGQPTVSVLELEDLRCPREHLAFSLWNLRMGSLAVLIRSAFDYGEGCESSRGGRISHARLPVAGD
jgi:hypothetical protein